MALPRLKQDRSGERMPARVRTPGAWFPSLLAATFFMPYFPGTSYRVDQVMAWLAIAALPLIVTRRLRREEWHLLWISSGMLCWVGLRVATSPDDGYFNQQLVNQYSYLLGGLCIFLCAKRRLDTRFFQAVLWLSIPINALAVYQSFYPNSPIVDRLLDLYGNVSFSDPGSLTYTTVAHLLVKSARRAVSIFIGMHTLAAYSLLTLALSLGMIRSEKTDLRWMSLPRFALLFSIAGGIASNSKTFMLGACIFAAVTVLLMRKRFMNLLGFVFLGGCTAVSFQVISSDKPTFDVFTEAFANLNVFDLVIQGRFDQYGALRDKWDIVFQPATLLIGLGAQVREHFYADCEYRQVILVGGLPLLLMFYGFVCRVALLNYRARETNPYALPFLALQVTWGLVAIGIAVHCQGRVTPVWLLLNLIALDMDGPDSAGIPALDEAALIRRAS